MGEETVQGLDLMLKGQTVAPEIGPIESRRQLSCCPRRIGRIGIGPVKPLRKRRAK